MMTIAILRQMRQGPLAILTSWRARRHFRGELRRLRNVGPHMIADIGLTQDQVSQEMTRPFWRP